MSVVLNPKALLFDLDGTLLDTYDLILDSMRYTTEEVLGEVIPAERLMEKVGQPLAIIMADFANDEAILTRLLEVYRDHNYKVHDEKIEIFPGTYAMLEALSDQGYGLGVVTSKKRRPTLQGLSHFGIERYFSCIVCSDDLDTHKPDPAPVIHAARLLGMDAPECCFVGDSPFDMQAGRRAEAVTVAALWGMFPRNVLEAECPAYFCEAPLDVLTLPFLQGKS